MDARSPYFVSHQAVEKVLVWDDVIDRLRHAYSLPHDDLVNPPRAVARHDGVWLRTLSAVPPGAITWEPNYSASAANVRLNMRWF